jgi:hypothetical protein
MNLTAIRPSSWSPSLRVAKSLLFDYGHLKSSVRRSSIDRFLQPVPWYTYPAIEYLRQLDFSSSTVFEYGCGNSTLYWASVSRRVVSVEEDDEWFGKMQPEVPANVELILETDIVPYVDVIHRFAREFDIIVVDGAARGGTRRKCSVAAIEHLRPGGMIILDNSDWLPESTRILRDANLIQVDMTGFAPISGRTQTTSFFLHREFAFKPRGERQPMPGPGAAEMVWEHPAPTEPPLAVCGGEVFGAVFRDQAFTIETPQGPRRFRLIGCGMTESGPAAAAIFDCDRDRVVLSVTGPTWNAPSAEAEIEPVLTMNWEAFARFINTHPKRRYTLPA